MPLSNCGYFAITEVWGSCYSSSGCGEGQRSRTVICSDDAGLKMTDVLCGDEEPRPVSQKPCFKVCQKDVKYVSWLAGEWGACEPGRSRSRSRRRCVGELRGTRKRSVKCVFHKNDYERVVDLRECRSVVAPQSKVACTVPCPQDCVVTKFSEWRSCDG